MWCTVRENEWQLSLRRLKIVKRLLDFAIGLMMNIESSSVETWGGGLAVGEWELEKVTPQSVTIICFWNSAVHPVIKTPSFHYRGHGFDPWLQKWHFTTKIQYASRCGQKTKQQETTWSVAKYIGLRRVRWGSFNKWYRLRWVFFFNCQLDKIRDVMKETFKLSGKSTKEMTLINFILIWFLCIFFPLL